MKTKIPVRKDQDLKYPEWESNLPAKGTTGRPACRAAAEALAKASGRQAHT